MTDPLLSIRDLYVSFATDDGPVHAVNGLNYEISKNETLGIVGESGSGKSVSSQAVMGLLPKKIAQLAPGSIIRFKNKDITSASDKELARIRGLAMGMIFQDPLTSLNPYMRIDKQMIEGVRYHLGMSKTKALHKAREILDYVQIPDAHERLRSYPHELSGGLRQRILIAMTLMTEPELIFADEPTTALDVTIQAQIMRLFAKLRSQNGMGIVMISHDLELVAQQCQKIVVMYAGQVMEAGSPEDVFENPRHPYTKGLKASSPSLKISDKAKPLSVIPGSPPNPRQLPKGCPFQERCSFVSAKCRHKIPETIVSPGHSAWCVEV